MGGLTYTPNDPIGQYQLEALDFMKSRESGALFLPMGTGKSWIIIEWMRYNYFNGNVFPVLIIAPVPVCYTWIREIEKFAPELSCVNMFHGTWNERYERYIDNMDRDVFIINYESVCKLPETDYQVFQTVVCDESTKTKNPQAKRTKSIHKMAEAIPYRWICTGTPIPNGIIDIWSQAFIIDRGSSLGTNFWRFRNRFFTPRQLDRGRFYVPQSGAEKDIRSRIRKYIFSRLRSECLTLPEQIFTFRTAEPTKEMRLLETEIKTMWRQQGTETNTPLVVDTWLRKLALGFDINWNAVPCNKYAVLADTLQEIGEAQVVIWTNFHEETDRIVSTLQSCGWFPEVVDGRVDHERRSRILTLFESGEVSIIIVSTAVGAFGINELRWADYAIYFSNNYDYELRRQSEDRLLRAGRTCSPIYIDIVTTNSIEQHITDILQRKERVDATFFRREIMRRLECDFLTLSNE